MRILSFNSRGLGGPEKGRYLRDIIAKESIDMACIQETKMVNITNEKCISIWGDNNIEWVHYGAENGAGGILSVWSKSKFSMLKSKTGRGFILLDGIWGDKKQQVTMVNLYSSCAHNDKKEMWEELTKCRRDCVNKVWCMVGDFNAIRNKEERRGVSLRGCQTNDIREFNAFIQNVDLLNIPMVGRKFTWYKANGTAKSRLDRILVSQEWLDL